MSKKPITLPQMKNGVGLLYIHHEGESLINMACLGFRKFLESVNQENKDSMKYSGQYRLYNVNLFADGWEYPSDEIKESVMDHLKDTLLYISDVYFDGEYEADIRHKKQDNCSGTNPTTDTKFCHTCFKRRDCPFYFQFMQ